MSEEKSATTDMSSYFIVGVSKASYLYEALREGVREGYTDESTVGDMINKAMLAKSVLIYFSPKWNSFVFEMSDYEKDNKSI